jgi:hypothetical protein
MLSVQTHTPETEEARKLEVLAVSTTLLWWLYHG